jgi:hypothetical protein
MSKDSIEPLNEFASVGSDQTPVLSKSGSPKIGEIHKAVFWHAFNVFMVFFITFLVFPGV